MIALVGVAMVVHATVIERARGAEVSIEGETPRERQIAGSVIAIAGTFVSLLGSWSLRHARDA
jgi:hypothetical protein